MNETIRIPCVLMRGGTSRGPVFLARDLPADPAARDAVLIAAMGAGHALQVDGLGGGNPLTSKVAIVGPASRADADVDYLFAQVKVTERRVDTGPNCGNMLAAVGPFAIEQGLIPARDGTTAVRIHNVNTGKIILAEIATPDGRVTYAGTARIDGVPGTAAPVRLIFAGAAGAKTGRLLPTGQARETIAGIAATCLDAATPVVILRAADFGKTGHETPAELDADADFLARLEGVRLEAAARMGLARPGGSVLPKPVLIAPARHGGEVVDRGIQTAGDAVSGHPALTTRYFMPHRCHTALAVTGAVAIAIACATPGTLAADIAGLPALPTDVPIAHPGGTLTLGLRPGANGVPEAALLRTARRIFEGTLFVDPASLDEAPGLNAAPALAA